MFILQSASLHTFTSYEEVVTKAGKQTTAKYAVTKVSELAR